MNKTEYLTWKAKIITLHGYDMMLPFALMVGGCFIAMVDNGNNSKYLIGGGLLGMLGFVLVWTNVFIIKQYLAVLKKLNAAYKAGKSVEEFLETVPELFPV